MKAAWLFVFGSPLLMADPGAVRVTAVPAKTEVTVGETFLLELKGEGPPGTSWTFPAEVVEEHVELRPAPPPSPAPGAAPGAAPPTNVMRYEATVFALKDAGIPALTVKYRLPDGSEGEAQSAAVPLEVDSVLPRDTQEQQLADIRGPVPLGIGRVFWIALATLALLLVGAVIWLLKRRRRQAPTAAPQAELSADQEALGALQALLASGQLERAEYRPFYIALTAIAKRYLERRLRAPVLEMTSAEMTAFLRDHPHGAAFASNLRELATAADRIKFARGAGQQQEAERHVHNVRELLAGLEARMNPAAPQTGGAS